MERDMDGWREGRTEGHNGHDIDEWRGAVVWGGGHMILMNGGVLLYGAGVT